MNAKQRTLSLAVSAVLASLWTLVSVSAQTNAPAPASPPASTTAQNAPPQPQNGPEQPIPFSHRVHAGTLQLTCESCHTMSRSGETLAIPQAAVCMDCHQSIATNNPGVQKLAAYAKSNQTIPWVRIYQLPSFVSFSHKTHLAGGATCAECHGQVAQQDRLFLESDISMAGCINCHRAKKASIDCNTCHTLEQ